MDPAEDSRLVELTAINRRLNTVMAFLKSKHTPDTLARQIEQASKGLDDHTAAFVPIDGVVVQATRHLGALLLLSDALEVRRDIGDPGRAADECVTLLQRKIELLQSLST